jgi:catechol-2,3-dioxygenase
MRLLAIFLGALGAGVLLGRLPARNGVIEAKLTNVVVTTSKMDAEATFFEKSFGFKEFYRDRTSVFLKTGSANLVLVRASSRNVESKHVCFDLGVPSVSDAEASLKGAGLAIDRADPAIIKLHDPDGNLIEVVRG